MKLKISLMSFLLPVSLALPFMAYGKEKYDVQNLNSNKLIAYSMDEFFAGNVISSGNYHYQNKVIMNEDSPNFYYLGIHCKAYSGREDKIKNTPLKDMYIRSWTGSYTFTDILNEKGLNLFYCSNVKHLSHLRRAIPTELRTTSKISIRGEEGNVELLGGVNSSSTEVIVSIDGVERIVDCDDLLLENAMNGDIESGTKALLGDLKTIVNVLEVGPKYAKIQNDSITEIVEVKDLKRIRKKNESSSYYVKGKINAFVKFHGAVDLGLLKGERYVVESNDEIFLLKPKELTFLVKP